ARSVGQVIVAADDVRDPHLDVVRNDGKVVDRRAVGSDDDEIVDLGVTEPGLAMDGIVPEHLALGHTEADGVGLACGGPLFRDPRIDVPAAPIVAVDSPAHLSSLAACLQFFGRAETPVSPAGTEQRLGVAPVALETVRLMIGALVPVEPQPPQAVEDRGGHLVAGALPVGVLDAQDEYATVPSRVQPVEERSPRPAHVQITGRTGSETKPRRLGHGRRISRNDVAGQVCWLEAGYA